MISFISKHFRPSCLSFSKSFRYCSTSSKNPSSSSSSLKEILENTKLDALIQKKQLGRTFTEIEEGSSIFDTIRKMDQKKQTYCMIHAKDLPKRYVGIFTDSDLSKFLVKKKEMSLDLKSTPIENVMTKDVISLSNQQTIGDMLAQMTSDQIHQIPIYQQNLGDDLDSDYELMYVLSYQDVMNEMVDHLEITSNEQLSKDIGEIIDHISKKSSENENFFVETREKISKGVELLHSRKIPMILILENFKLKGYFTMKQIVSLLAKEKNINLLTFESLKEEELPKPITIHNKISLKEALDIMKQNQLESLPIVPMYGNAIEYVDQYQKEIGLISTQDVIRFILEKFGDVSPPK